MSGKKGVCIGLAAILAGPAAYATSVRDAVAAAAGLGLAAAATSAALKSKRTELKAKRGETSAPEFGQTVSASAGEPIYASFNYDAVRTALVSEGFNAGSGYVFAGSTLFEMVNEKFCTADGTRCFQDKDRDGDLDKADYGAASGRKADVPYVESTVFLDASQDGFRSELVYQGAGGGVLRIAYREFVDDMARPAFTQVATFDLAQEGPTRFVFQDLLFEVLQAGNMGITYSVSPRSE